MAFTVNVERGLQVAQQLGTAWVEGSFSARQLEDQAVRELYRSGTSEVVSDLLNVLALTPDQAQPTLAPHRLVNTQAIVMNNTLGGWPNHRWLLWTAMGSEIKEVFGDFIERDNKNVPANVESIHEANKAEVLRVMWDLARVPDQPGELRRSLVWDPSRDDTCLPELVLNYMARPLTSVNGSAVDYVVQGKVAAAGILFDLVEDRYEGSNPHGQSPIAKVMLERGLYTGISQALVDFSAKGKSEARTMLILALNFMAANPQVRPLIEEMITKDPTLE